MLPTHLRIPGWRPLLASYPFNLAMPSHSLSWAGSLLPPFPFKPSLKSCQWALPVFPHRLSSHLEISETHLVLTSSVQCRPFHCQNYQCFVIGTSHEDKCLQIGPFCSFHCPVQDAEKMTSALGNFRDYHLFKLHAEKILWHSALQKVWMDTREWVGKKTW